MAIKNLLGRWGIGFSPGSLMYVVTRGLSLSGASATFGTVMALGVRAEVPLAVTVRVSVTSVVKVEATLPSGIKIIAIG